MKVTTYDGKPFIHLFKNSLGFFLYDVNKNKVIKIPHKMYYYLEEDTERNRLPIDKEIIDYLNKLKCSGFLKSNHVEISEHPITEIYDAYISNKMSHVTLQVTQKCNLSCNYCAYSGWGCGRFLGLLKQQIQGFAGTPMDSYFQVIF
jgi:uncharacterized protein